MYGPAISEYEKFIQANPHSPELASARFRYADSYYFTKNYRSAIAYFEAFLRDFPSDKRASMARFRVGTSNYFLGAYDAAVRTFLGVVKEAPDPTIRSGALFYLAKSDESLGKPDKALPIYRQLTKGYPQSEYASYAAVAIGDFELAQKHPLAAAKAYELAAQKPTPIEIAREARFKAAEIYFSQKDYAKAKTYYGMVFDENTDAPDSRIAALKDKALTGLFYCDYYLGDLVSSDSRLRNAAPFIEKSSSRPDILLIAATLRDEKGQPAGALDLINLALTDPMLDADMKEKLLLKKSQVLQKTDQRQGALEAIEKIFQAKPQGSARAYFEKAQLLAAMGKPADALAGYKAVIADYGQSEYAAASYYEAGRLAYKAGQTEAARNDFSACLKRFPQDPNAEKSSLELVQISLDEKDFGAALTQCVAFVQKYPQSAFLDIADYKEGVALAGLGRFKEAAAVFGDVTRNFRDSQLFVDALYGAATSLEQSGEFKASLPFYERIVNDYPDHALANDVLSRLGYLYIRSGEPEKMKALYVDILFNRPHVRVRQEGVLWLLGYLVEHHDFSTVEKVVAILPQRFPGQDLSHEAQFFLGESAFGLKDYAGAMQHYSEAARLKPNGPYAAQAYLGMGLTAEATHAAASAEKYFGEALRFDQEVKVGARARLEMANIRFAAKDYKEAAKAYMLVAILYDDPRETPEALYRAAECFLRVNQIDDAQKAFAELASRYPKSVWARKASRIKPPETAA